MKRTLFFFFAVLLFCYACSSSGMKGNPAAIMVGSRVGGLIGGIVGDPQGRHYGGRMLGSIIGTVAGATVANVLTTPRDADDEIVDDYEEENPVEVQKADPTSKSYSHLSIRKIRFIDSNRNHVIESGENCQLVFLVMNKGNQPVYNVTPIVEEFSGMKHLFISPTVSVEKIMPGEGIKYTANIKAGHKLKTSEALFRVYALDGDGSTSRVREFSLPTQKVKKRKS